MRPPLRIVFRAAGLCLIVVVVFAAKTLGSQLMLGEPLQPGQVLVGELLTFFPWLLLWPLAFAAARRFPLVGRGRRWHSLVLLACGVLLAIAHVVIAVPLASLLRGDLSLPVVVERLHATIPRALGPHLVIFAVLVAAAHALAFRRDAEARAGREVQLAAALSRAELERLRMQLHPHFLFNTLHAVSALMTRDVAGARRMIAGLSELLRVSLERDDGEAVPLARELEILELYLRIQQTRFSDRLTVTVDAAPDTLLGHVPKLILQPLVENAIRHGIEPRSGPGTVIVTARRHHDRLLITVADDGVGLPDGELRAGVGVANTRARLDGLYGDAHRFALTHGPGGGAVVTLELPLSPAHVIA